MIGYVAIINSNGTQTIKKYDLSSGNAVYMGQYLGGSSTLKISRFFFYGDYMIGYANSSQTYNVYNESSYAFLGTHQLNETVNLFEAAKSRGLILFTTTSGNAGYIYEANFPFPTTNNVHYFAFSYGPM